MIRFLLFLIVLGSVYFVPLKHMSEMNKVSQNRNKGHPVPSYDNELAPQIPSDAKTTETLRFIASNTNYAKQQDSLYNVLASITMAQAIIESRNGQSKLVKKNNNYFGIKCFSKICNKNHCSNFTDDSHKDFFRIFKNKEESYVAHSLLLKKDLYKSLYEDRNYRNWALKLKNCHYATDSSFNPAEAREGFSSQVI